MSFQGKAILLTGAAATGKSTLAKVVTAKLRPIHRVDFGKLFLARRIAQGAADLTCEGLRSQSGRVITSEDAVPSTKN